MATSTVGMMRAVILVLLLASLGTAEVQMSVEQLRAFVTSSKRLGHPDKQIAEFLKTVKLTERFDAAAIEDLQGAGAGTRTMEALRKLSEGTSSLPAAKAPPPKPVVAAIPSPDSIEQKTVLAAATEYARNYSKSLPNFICTQVTRRYYDPAGMEFWRQLDVITAKLSFFEQKEDYKVVLVNNQMVNTSIDRLGGTTTRGEFGSRLAEIFEAKSQTRFEWERWATLRGRRMHVFSYSVPENRSKFTINFENTNLITVGYKGLIYVDRDTSAVMRFTQEPENMPYSYPIQGIRVVLDYDRISIAGTDYILPLRSVNNSRTGKTVYKNEIEFRMYNRFGVESNITFTPEPLTDEQVNEQGAEQPAAPPPVATPTP